MTTPTTCADERERFWREFHEAYERLAADDEAWADIEAERAGEANALRDGLDED